MKKKIILSLATAAAVLTPIATVVACGDDTHHSLNYKEGDSLVKGGAKEITGKELFEKDESYASTFSNDFSEYTKQAMFVLYNNEVEAAKPLQLSKFRYQQFLNQLQLSRNITKKATADALIPGTGNGQVAQAVKTSRVTAAVAAVKASEDAIKELDKKITTLSGADWKTKVTYDYHFPLLLKPYDDIYKAKEKVFQDRKKNWVSGNVGPKQGAKTWPEQLRKTYGGATTDAEAVIFLTDRAVAGDAIKSTQFKVESAYTYKEYTFHRLDTINKSFDFLDGAHTWGEKEATQKAKQAVVDGKFTKMPDDPDDTNKAEWETFTTAWDDSASSKVLNKRVYFISSRGKNVKPLGLSETGFVQDVATSEKLIKVQHGIIPFIRSETNPDAAWTIKEAELKGLLYAYGDGTTTGLDNYFNPKLFGTASGDDKFTTMTLHMGKADGTSDIQGSLGIKTTLDYVKTMVPGFALALLQKEGDVTGTGSATTAVTPKDFDGTTLKTNIDAKLNALYTKYQLTTNPKTTFGKNKKLDSLFTLASAEVITQVGIAVRDTFKAMVSTKNQQLIYKVGPNNLVVSKFGIHLIKVSEYKKTGGTATTISDLVKTDLDKMAEKQNQSSSTGIISLANSKYAQPTKLLNYIQHNTTNPTLTTAFTARLLDFNTKAGRVSGNPEKIKKALTDTKLEDLIQRVELVIKTKVISDSIDAKVKWVNAHLDGELLDKKITPEEIYKWAVVAGGK